MANVLYGLDDTHSITLENIIQHTCSVKKGTNKSLLVVDMPKGSYTTAKVAKKNARLVLRKTGCDAIKIESNGKNSDIIKKISKSKNTSDGSYRLHTQFKKKFRVEGKF